MNIKSEKGDRDMNNERLDKDNLLKKYNTSGLIKYLNGIIDEEIGKSTEMDADIINECVNWILELKGSKSKFSEDEIKKRVKLITEKNYVQKRKRFRFHYAAAIIIVMIFSFQIVSVAAFKFDFFDWTKDIFLTLIGVEIQQDNISHTASHSRDYKTLEEFMLAENIEITVPFWMPGDIEIESISYFYAYKDKIVNLIYNDNVTSLLIIFDSFIPNKENAKIYENNNIIFYLFENVNALWWENNGNFYNLTCGFDAGNYAERIIENIK